MANFLKHCFDPWLQKLYHIAVTDIPLHQYKRNCSITCNLPESWSVLCGTFLYFHRVLIFIFFLCRVDLNLRESIRFSSSILESVLITLSAPCGKKNECNVYESCIMHARPRNEDPITFHFYIIRLGLYIGILLFLLQNLDRYVYQRSMFWAKLRKKYNM